MENGDQIATAGYALLFRRVRINYLLLFSQGYFLNMSTLFTGGLTPNPPLF